LRIREICDNRFAALILAQKWRNINYFCSEHENRETGKFYRASGKFLQAKPGKSPVSGN
jgi:hypothetical protein